MPSVSLDDVLESLSGVRKHSTYHSALCPFHDDHNPSLLVFEDHFICLSAGCGEKGSLRKLAERLKGYTAPVGTTGLDMRQHFPWWEVTRIGVEKFVQQASDMLGQDCDGSIKYLQSRGVWDVAEANDLGYWKGWYVIPIGSSLTVRAGPRLEHDVASKYENMHGSGTILYVPKGRPDRRRASADYRVAVFGIFDAMFLRSLGYPAVTNNTGALGFSPTLLDPFRCRVYIIPDKGEEKAAENLSRGLDWRGKVVELNYPKSVKDPNGFYPLHVPSLQAQLSERLRG